MKIPVNVKNYFVIESELRKKVVFLRLGGESSRSCVISKKSIKGVFRG